MLGVAIAGQILGGFGIDMRHTCGLDRAQAHTGEPGRFRGVSPRVFGQVIP